MPQWNRFVAAKNTYQSYEDFAWATWKERETLTEAVSSLEARVAELDGECGAWNETQRNTQAISDHYRVALERIEAHWNGIDGEISPTLMANIAIDALHP